MDINSSLAVQVTVQAAVQAVILFPRSGTLVSQNFFPGFQLTVPDDAFLQVEQLSVVGRTIIDAIVKYQIPHYRTTLATLYSTT